MSPSWTKKLRLLPGTAKRCLGIAFHRASIDAVLVEHQKGAPVICWTRTVQPDFPLFSGIWSDQISASLTETLRGLIADVAKDYTWTQISIPDPVMSASVLELDVLPAKSEAQQALARWRLSRELLVNEDKQVCAVQPLGHDQNKELLFAVLMEAELHKNLRRAFENANVMMGVMDAAGCHLFNMIYPTHVINGRGEALVFADQDSWSTLIWDDQRRLRRIRSRWRELFVHGETGSDMGEIASQVEQTVLAYVHSSIGKTVRKIYVIGESSAELADQLDQRLQQPCERLFIEEEFRLRDNDHVSTMGLAAGLAR